jgi:hypothetical protein
VTYEPARLVCLEGYAVACLHQTEDESIEIKGTFRARRSVTAIMIAAEGDIVYDGLVDSGQSIKYTIVPVSVRSFGKMAAFESCHDPIVLEDVRRGRFTEWVTTEM